MRNATMLALAFAALGNVSTALAHGDERHAVSKFDPKRAEQKPFGIAADPKRAQRTMTITMYDQMRFVPESIVVRTGETVRFVVRNEGKLLHELVLGTGDELAKHAELMRKFPNMEHEEPHMLHVKPGQSGDLVWTFNKSGEFRFACLVAGHYEAGMKGRILVR